MEPPGKPPQILNVSHIRPLHVLRDVIIIFLLTTLGGFVIGIAAHNISDKSTVLIAIGISNILFTTLGFLIAGCLTVQNRWKHLFTVAFFLWVASLVNVIFFEFNLIQWALGLIAIFVAMGIGGGIAVLLRKNHN